MYIIFNIIYDFDIIMVIGFIFIIKTLTTDGKVKFFKLTNAAIVLLIVLLPLSFINSL